MDNATIRNILNFRRRFEAASKELAREKAHEPILRELKYRGIAYATSKLVR